MRRWRPGFRAFFIIPEVRGNLTSLEVILNRILPLRKYEGQRDDLLFMGGLIDGDEDGGKVLDTYLTIKKEYGDRVNCLMGDQEYMMLKAYSGSEKDYIYWVQNGGSSTISGYLKSAGIKGSAESLPHTRLKDIIPLIHIELISSFPFYWEYDDFFFVHGGWNYKNTLENSNPITFAFDNTISGIYQRTWRRDFLDVEKLNPDGKIMVTTHNSSKKPIIYPRCMFLGPSAPNNLLCIDINSMEMVKAKRNKTRIYKTTIKTYE